MVSSSLTKWNGVRQRQLDELLTAHQRVGGGGPGRRYATEQLNFAYLVAIAAQFQGFCRDLHTEAVEVISAAVAPELAPVVSATFSRNRRLDRGNANSGTIADDFGRIGMTEFWLSVARRGGQVRTRTRLRRIEQMNMWRNAIAHSNFEHYHSQLDKLDGVLRPRAAQVGSCRVAATRLASQMSEAVAAHLARIVGMVPW